MRKITLFPSSLLLLNFFLLGAALVYEAWPSSVPIAASVAALGPAEEYNDRSRDGDLSQQALCPATHTTVLVRLFGDGLCPVQVPASSRPPSR